MRDCWWSSVWQLFVMHFWFDQYYYQSVKKKKKRIEGIWNGSQECGDPGRRPRWGPLFAFLPLIHRPVCAVVLFLVFSGGEMSLLIQVVWAGACARLQRTNETCTWWADLDPISNICPLGLVERMPSYANFYTRSVEPFNMHLCFLSFYVNLKSPFILLNIQASWCQTCWFGVNGFGNFLRTCFKTETLLFGWCTTLNVGIPVCVRRAGSTES